MDPMHDMIESLARLSLLPEEAAKMAAPIVERVVKANVRAGKTPDGTPWLPKKDGGRALVNAEDHLKVTAQGTVVRVQLSGVDVIHNYGTQLGAARAQQLVASPKAFARKLESRDKRAFAKAKKAAKDAGNEAPSARHVQSQADHLGRYHTPPRQIIPNRVDVLPVAYSAAMKQGADAAFLKLQGAK